MEKRKHPRITIRNLTVDVNDGNEFFYGMIADVSRNGIRINELSGQLDTTAPTIMVVISGKENYFRMFVKPKWWARERGNTTLGAEIVKIPWSWKEFIMKNEPASEEDVSDLVRRVRKRQKPQNDVSELIQRVHRHQKWRGRS